MVCPEIRWHVTLSCKNVEKNQMEAVDRLKDVFFGSPKKACVKSKYVPPMARTYHAMGDVRKTRLASDTLQSSGW